MVRLGREPGFREYAYKDEPPESLLEKVDLGSYEAMQYYNVRLTRPLNCPPTVGAPGRVPAGTGYPTSVLHRQPEIHGRKQHTPLPALRGS